MWACQASWSTTLLDQVSKATPSETSSMRKPLHLTLILTSLPSCPNREATIRLPVPHSATGLAVQDANNSRHSCADLARNTVYPRRAGNTEECVDAVFVPIHPAGHDLLGLRWFPAPPSAPRDHNRVRLGTQERKARHGRQHVRPKFDTTI